jgi:hypothetical protein
MTITNDQAQSFGYRHMTIGQMNAVLNHPLHITLAHLPWRKRIVPALKIVFRGRVTIPGPRL